MRQTVVRPLGLITQPNEQGQYPPGALSRAHNVVIRRPGVLTALPGSEILNTNLGASPNTMRRILPANAQVSGGDEAFYIWRDLSGGSHALLRVTAGTDVISFPELTAQSDSVSYSTGKLQGIEHRDRYYLTTDQGIFEIADVDTTSAYLAGWPPPRTVRLDALSTTAASVLADDTTVAYKAVFVRRDADGEIEKVSPPSYSLRVRNETGFTVDPEIEVAWPDATTLEEGDLVELYRTPAQDVNVDPGNAYYLAASIALTSSELSAQSVTLTDYVTDAGLGAELYTNEIFGGEAKAKFPPGLASDLATFDGYTFYVQEEEASELQVRVPGHWGTLGAAEERTHGIGNRVITGDVSSGSANISNISDTTGLVPGQLVSNAAFSAGTTLVSVNHGGSSAVASNNSSVSDTDRSLSIYDQLEVNGDTIPVPYIVTSFGAADGLLGGLPADNPVHILLDRHAEALPTADEVGVSLRFFMPHHYYGDVTLRATNGQNYDPPLPEIDETAKTGSKDPRTNRLRISEKDQPWAVAPDEDSEILVGNGDIHRIIPTTDILYVFCSDGLYRVTGPDWVVDQIDPTLTLASRNSVDVLKDEVWAYTSRGLVRIHSGGVVEEISEGLIGDEDNLPGQAYADTWDLTVAADEANAEVHVLRVSDDQSWVFNTRAAAFTTTNYDSSNDKTAIAYSAARRKLVWALSPGSNARQLRQFSDISDSEDSVAGGATIIFQPVTGEGDNFTLKEWIDCTFDMTMYATSGSLNVYPEFSDVSQIGHPIELPADAAGPSRHKAITGIDLDASLANTIAPGFTTLHSSLSSALGRWEFYGLSLRWMPASEEGEGLR